MWGLVLPFIFSAFVMAEIQNSVLLTTIENVDVPANLSDETLVFAHAEGRVLKVNTNDSLMVDAFKKAKSDGYIVSIEFNEEGSVLGAKLIGKGKKNVKQFAKINELDGYEPTVVSSLDVADDYFWEMRSRAKRWSQCFNRAHTWAHDLWSAHSLKSMKVFLFFTTKYIREYNYKWWFHVSPYVLVNVNGNVEERVLDRTFTDGPYTMKDWTDEFMHDEATCPVVKKYSDYRNNQWSQSCYLMKLPMYYWEPNNIEALETQGTRYTNWDYSQVNTARRQAFW